MTGENEKASTRKVIIIAWVLIVFTAGLVIGNWAGERNGHREAVDKIETKFETWATDNGLVFDEGSGFWGCGLSE